FTPSAPSPAPKPSMLRPILKTHFPNFSRCPCPIPFYRTRPPPIMSGFGRRIMAAMGCSSARGGAQAQWTESRNPFGIEPQRGGMFIVTFNTLDGHLVGFLRFGEALTGSATAFGG